MNKSIDPKTEWEKRIKKTDYVLDVGCWSGDKVLQLKDKCKKIYGIDINTQRFKFANPEVKSLLFYGDVTKEIPFNEKFDWIILGEVLEHLENDELAIKNIRKSLKKGGKVIISTPRNIPFFNFWDPAWVRWKFGGQRHYHYTEEELFNKLKKYGLEVKEFYVLGDFFWVLRRWTNVILRYVLRSKKQIKAPMNRGFCDLVVLAEKVK